MTKIGELHAEGAGGEVFQTNEGFLVRLEGIKTDSTDSARIVSCISETFPTLGSLREHYKGCLFRSLGGVVDRRDIEEFYKIAAVEYEKRRTKMG